MDNSGHKNIVQNISDIHNGLPLLGVNTAQASEKSSVIDGEDFVRLQKSNFNMKLRIFYLEERLAKVAHGNGAPDVATLEEELFQQRMLCEEKTNELEERNVLLIKARNAIESLHGDLELARAEVETAFSTESHPLLHEKNARIHELEDELKVARGEVDSKTKTVEELQRTVEELTARAHEEMDALANSKHLEKENTLSKERVATMEVEMAQMMDKCNTMEQQIQILQPAAEAHTVLSEHISAKEEQIMKLTVERGELKSHIEELQEAIGNKEMEQGELKEESTKLVKVQAEEISRLEAELHDAMHYQTEDREAKESAERNLEDSKEALHTMTLEMRALEKKFVSAEVEIQTLKELKINRDIEIAAQLTEKESLLRSEFMHKLGEKDQALAEATSKYTTAEFSLVDAKRQLEGEKEEAKRQNILMEEMQRRIGDLEEGRRRDEQERMKALEDLLSEKERSEEVIKELNENLRRVRATSVAEVEQIRGDSHQREAQLRQHFQQWERLLQANLSEIFSPGSGDSSTLALEDEIQRQMDEQELSSTSRVLNADYPRRRVLDQLGQIRRLRDAFKKAVEHAERKYLRKAESMQSEMESKEKELLRLNEKMKMLSSKVLESARDRTYVAVIEAERKEERAEMLKLLESNTKFTMEAQNLQAALENSRAEYSAQLEKTKQLENHLQDSVINAKDVSVVQKKLLQMEAENSRLQASANTARAELENRVRENETYRVAIETAQKEVGILEHTQTRLHRQINMRDAELKRYAHEMHLDSRRQKDAYQRSSRRHENSGGGFNMDTDTIDSNEERVEALRSVNATQEFIQDSKTTLELGRQRYERSKALSSGIMGDNGNGDAPLGLSQLRTGTAHQTVQSSEHQYIHDDLNDQKQGLEHLVRQIDELVENTGTYLERYFAMQKAAQEDGGNSQLVNLLQRDVMTLLDSNAKLSLQLQSLGLDLQKIYRRFKIMEAKIGGREA